MTPIQDFLSELTALGVKLWREDEELRIRAPKGVLSKEMVAQLRERKAEMLEYLQKRAENREKREERIPNVSRDQDLELSYAQNRLWFLDQLEPGHPFYNIPSAYRLKGVYKPEIIELSFNLLIKRHESLRTTFVEKDGRPLQKIAPKLTIPLGVIDLAHFSPEDREQHAVAILDREAHTPFDLTTGPLVRVYQVKLAPDDSLLILTLHHIISDGWSVGVLNRELLTLYHAINTRTQPVLPPLLIQYPDYAAWQRNWLEDGVLARQLAYWKENLADLSTLELYTDHPRPPVETFRGSAIQDFIDAELTAGLMKLAKQEDATLFMVMIGAFATLLGRYSRQQDIVIGSPIANRKRTEIENLIGFFVNTLVIRNNLSGDPSFRELIARTRKAALGAYANQDVPFEKLVDEVGVQRDMSRAPVFQVMYALQNAPQQVDGETVGDMGIQTKGVTQQFAKFDLTLFTMEVGDRISYNLEYNTDLFNLDTIERMADHYLNLLAQVVANPDQPLSQINLISSGERNRLIAEWNSTDADFSFDRCCHHMIEEQIRKTPDEVALVAGDVTLTYGELGLQANRLASYLRGLGVGPEVVVGVMLERGAGMVIGFLGVIKAGGAVVALDPAYPVSRLTYVIRDANLSVIITETTFKDVIPEDVDAQALLMDQADELLAAQGEPEDMETGVSVDNLLYVIYTSGSTGMPKGIGVPHRAILNLLDWQTRKTSLCGKDATVQFAAFGFCVSFQEILSTLSSGGTLYVAGEEERRDMEQLLKFLETHQITRLHLPFAALKQLSMFAERQDRLPGKLREVITAGEPLQITPEIRSVFNRLGDVNLHNQYGASETHVVSSLTLEGDPNTWAVQPSAGRPIANNRIYLLDHHLEPAPTGTPGVVYVSGTGPGRGYINRPADTAEKFIPDPFSEKPGERLYRTGDLARFRSNGNITFLGRADEMVKVQGYRVEPGEIEAALREHATINDAAVLPLKDKVGEYRLAAYITAAPNQIPDPAELRQYLKQRMPVYMVPAAFVIMDSLPITTHGKLDRESLPVPDTTRETVKTPYVAPVTQTAQMVASIWADLLEVDQVGLNDNFFDLGGHSLLATQVFSRLRDAFQINAPLKILFEEPELDAFSRCIEAEQRQQKSMHIPSMSSTDREGDIPLSFAQQRLWFVERMARGQASKPNYNISSAMRIQGPLSPPALEWAWGELINRHETLRTTFPDRDGVPRQHIAQPQAFPFPMRELSGSDPEKVMEEAMALVNEETGRTFQLEEDRLIRAMLLKLGVEDHVLVVAMHHIISDGWSLSLMVREWTQLYAARLMGQPSPLAPLPLQYADFAHWQRELMASGAFDVQMNYWREQLADAPSQLTLPMDRPRPALTTFRGDLLGFQIDRETTQELHQLGKGETATLFMTLQTAFALFLHRFSGQNDLCLGTPVANRNYKEIEPLIGFFVNTLVLRHRLDPNQSFLQLLREARRVNLDAFTHQDVPFEQVIEMAVKDRDVSHNPLIQVMFILQNTPPASADLPQIKISNLNFEHKTSKFDLTLSMVEGPDGVRGMFEYNTDLFDQATIERFRDHFLFLLDLICKQPQTPVCQLPGVPEREKEAMLTHWGVAKADYPRERSLPVVFEETAARFPNRLAVREGEEILTYEALNRRANRWAHVLLKHGVAGESGVAFCLTPSLELPALIIGIVKAGGYSVPLESKHPTDRMAVMAEGSQILITQKSLEDQAPEHPNRLLMEDLIPQLAECAEDAVGVTVHPQQLAMLLFTSGSTGRPKGVGIAHRGQLRLIKGSNMIRFDEEDVVVQVGSLAFDMAHHEIWGPLLNGGLVVIPQEPVHERLHEHLMENQATKAILTTQIFHLLVNERMEALASLKAFVVGGEALSPEHARRYLETHDGDLVNGYGPTENTGATTCAHIRETGAGHTAPIGGPTSNTRIYILNHQLQPLPVGVAGELCTGGDGLSRGYHGQPAMTAERFTPDPFLDGERIYHTGDLVRRLANGNLIFLGRIDRQVKLRGYRIEPGEIENRLNEAPGVDEAAVVVWRRNNQPYLTAYLSHAGEPEPEERLRGWLGERLPDYMIPEIFVNLEQLPLTRTGKIDRAALLEPARGGKEQVAPRTDLERDLAQIWETVLALENVGVYDNFFELGGNSLSSIRLTALIEKQTGVSLPVSVLFQKSSIAALAQWMEEEGGEEAVLTLLKKGQGQALFLIHPIGGRVHWYVTLAGLLNHPGPVYGLQAPALVEGGDPFDQISTMARDYVARIREIQPEGALLLGGWSMGGSIAFEMACQLQSQGEQSAGLILMDTVNKTRRGEALDAQAALDAHFGFAMEVLGPGGANPLQWMRDLSAQPPNHRRDYLLEQVAERLGFERNDSRLAAMHAAYTAHRGALITYQPQEVYEGSVLLIRAEGTVRDAASYLEPSDHATFGWKSHCGKTIETHDLQGDHYSIFEGERARQLAGLLDQFLQK